MKHLIKPLTTLLLLAVFTSCDSDDGSSSNGNTLEYFKYSIDGGANRIFDNEIEAHLETNTNTIIDRYEINATGIRTDGSLRRIAASFAFNSNGNFMPNITYDWGIAQDNTPAPTFYFAESTIGNFFLITADHTVHPIITMVNSSNPTIIGDYIEFSFNGSFQDDSNITHSISGECRVQRGVDQNFP